MKLPENLKNLIGPIIKTCESQFPRACGNCGKKFPDFRSFITETRPIGDPRQQAEEGAPLGLMFWVNCECGSTLLLSCADKEAHKEFPLALNEAAEKTGISKKDLLLAIRDEVRGIILSGKKG